MKKFDFLVQSFLLTVTLVLLSVMSYASDDFCAWELKTGHNGITGTPLAFTEKSMTLELWLNMAEGKNETEKMTILGTMDNNNRGVLLSLRKNAENNNALEIRFFAVNPQKANILFFIPVSEFTGKWGHLAFVVSEAENKAYAYVNGNLYSATTATGGWIGNSNIALSIGSWYSDPKLYGKIADVRVWKTARTADEIKINFRKHIEENNPDLVVNYQFTSYQREISNVAGSSNHAVCNPELNWNLYHGHEILVQKPTDILINQYTVTWSGKNTLAADNEITGNYIVTIEPETGKNLRNPLTGWVLYGSPGSASDFWIKLDNISVPGVSNPVQIADYANTLYIRTSWTTLNPSEGVYGWNTNTGLKWMIDNARQRGMRLAFRVVVDSRDKSEDFTPKYVKDAGAEGFTSGSNNQRWSPYPDDQVFQAKYAKFVEAFAQKFNDPDVVEFIDGFGLGLWGEAHNMRYKNYSNRENVLKWVVDLYTKHFTKIPLVINYHRLIGTEKSWGSPDADSERLLEYAFNKGYVLRQDAFGMTDYYQQWEKNIVAKWVFKRPIIMEGGWVTNSHSWWNDPRGYVTVADVRQGEFDDSKEARVNTMDFRINEVFTWFESSFNLVKEFIAEGGYRLYPDRLSLPKEVNSGSTITIAHRWNNLGWGYCPTNISAWNQKYKVAFGLMDSNDNVVASMVDNQTDLSKWQKGTPSSYVFTTSISGVPAGLYKWVAAIVDVTKNNVPGIQISAKENITATGWLQLFDVKIK
ncbi:MAG: LamG-like jellyroll fold domain-containing protein [Paludibacteraceae bacterium]